MIRCLNCMSVLEEGQRSCPKCGWQVPAAFHDDDDDVTIQSQIMQPEDPLIPGMLLSGRYVIGNEKKKDACYRIYTGFDELFSRKVLILEYFPVMLCRREPEGRLKIQDGKGAAYHKGLTEFRSHGEYQIRMDGTGQVLEVFAVVDECNTCYAVLEYPGKGQTVEQIVGFVNQFVESLRGSSADRNTNQAAAPQQPVKKKKGLFGWLFR